MSVRISHSRLDTGLRVATLDRKARSFASAANDESRFVVSDFVVFGFVVIDWTSARRRGANDASSASRPVGFA